MGEFWMSFMKISDILLQNVDVCHVGNLDGYLLSSRVMLPEMLAYDNHDYNKWLPDYWVLISFFPYEKKKYFSKHFAQSMTDLPWSNQPMDLLIGVTMNLDSKLKQGWIQLLQNNTQLLCTTVSEACEMPSSNNKQGWTGYTRFDSLYGWFWCWSIW